jgi:hypothetical protein
LGYIFNRLCRPHFGGKDGISSFDMCRASQYSSDLEQFHSVFSSPTLKEKAKGAGSWRTSAAELGGK